MGRVQPFFGPVLVEHALLVPVLSAKCQSSSLLCIHTVELLRWPARRLSGDSPRCGTFDFHVACLALVHLPL